MASENNLSEIFVGKYLHTSLLNELNAQRNASKYCDVILKVFDAQIPAHSNVLAAGSPYICAFLAQTMPRQYSQASPQIIELQIDDKESKDLYQTAVKKIIEFIYTTTIEINETELPKIMLIAKILQMGQIVYFCESFSERVKDAGTVKCITVIDKNVPDGDAEECSNVPMDGSGQEDETESSRELENRNVHNRTRGGTTCSRGRGRPRGVKRLSRSHDHRYTQNENLLKRKNVTKPIQDSKMIYIKSTKPRFKKRDIAAGDKDKNVEGDSEGVTKVSGVRKSSRQIKPNPRHVQEDFDGFSKEKREEDSVIIDSDEQDSHEEEEDGSFAMHNSRDSVNPYDPLACLAEARQFKCSKCDYKTTNSYRFKRHLSVHAGGKYSCDNCDFSTAKLKELSIHRREHVHEKNVCSFCSHKAESKEELKEHLAKHDGPMPHFCQFCDKRFKTQTMLKSHIPIHSDEKPFVCSVCSVGFKWKHALKNHMIVHSEEKNHLCDVCGYATAHKSQLKAHRLLHTGETFKCHYPECNFQAIKKQNLKYHQLTHTREKPHQCEICGQSFSLVKNLRRHMMLHSAVKPHQCEQCSFSTTRYDKLKEHLRRQHSIGKATTSRTGQLQMLTNIPVVENTNTIITSVASTVEQSACIQPEQLQTLQPSVLGVRPLSPAITTQHIILNSDMSEQQVENTQKLAATTFNLPKAEIIQSTVTVPSASLDQLGTACTVSVSQTENASVLQSVELGTCTDAQAQILPAQNIVALRPMQYFEIQFPIQNVEVVDLKQEGLG